MDSRSRDDKTGSASNLCCGSKKMPVGLSAVLNFVPTVVWIPLKKFIKDDKVIVFDIPFKFSTKYTPALLTVMICLSFANELVRDVDIECQTSDHLSIFGPPGSIPSVDNEELNTFCWNHETFLVERALSSSMRGRVTFPGISGREGSDDIIKQRYYKYVWFGLGMVTLFTFCPYFLWKFRGAKKIEVMVKVKKDKNKKKATHAQAQVVNPGVPMPRQRQQEMGWTVPQQGNPNEESEDDTSEETSVTLDPIDITDPQPNKNEIRASKFCETIGLNNGFGIHYLACKILAMFTPLLGWYYLCGFLGGRYKSYGLDVMLIFTDSSDPWPHPMDALFPKMAKCEWARYGITGDREVKSAQCKLPMNNLSQWSFFILWWWLMAVFALNLVSVLKLVFLMYGPYRTHRYRKFVTIMCREELQGMGDDVEDGNPGRDAIKINLKFGEWLVLSLLKKNLSEKKFRGFIRALIKMNGNGVIEFKSKYYRHNLQHDQQFGPKSRPSNIPIRGPSADIGFRRDVIYSPIREGSAPPFDINDQNRRITTMPVFKAAAELLEPMAMDRRPYDGVNASLDQINRQDNYRFDDRRNLRAQAHGLGHGGDLSGGESMGDVRRPSQIYQE